MHFTNVPLSFGHFCIFFWILVGWLNDSIVSRFKAYKIFLFFDVKKRLWWRQSLFSKPLARIFFAKIWKKTCNNNNCSFFLWSSSIKDRLIVFWSFWRCDEDVHWEGRGDRGRFTVAPPRWKDLIEIRWTNFICFLIVFFFIVNVNIEFL